MSAWLATAITKRDALVERLEKGWTLCEASPDRADLADHWLRLLTEYQRIDDALQAASEQHRQSA